MLRGPADRLQYARAAMAPAGAGPRRMLVIQVSDGEGQANARLPLGVVRSGNGSRLIPRQVRQRLEHHDIDLEELLKSLDAEDLGPMPKEAPLLHIQDGEGELRIAIEGE